jgi:CRISPR-associated protein Csx10
MKVILYRIYLEQPLLATQMQGDPNSSVSFDYIPGSLMRGMLVNRYIERHKLAETDILSNPDCRRLFFSGETRYLHAYPLTSNEHRSLPTPLSLFKHKTAEFENKSMVSIYNMGHEELTDEERQDAEEEEALKSVNQNFWLPTDESNINLYKVQHQLAVHVFRQRSKGRATREQGAVFQYDALAPGQWFAGVILVDTDADATTIGDLLQPDIAWMGRSRSANYGQVRITLDPNIKSDWREIGSTYQSISAKSYVTLTLLSDTLLRDQDGQPVATLAHQPIAHEPTSEDSRLLLEDTILSAYLGVRVLIDCNHSFTASIQVGGFNRAWRLPLQQTYALRAGSVIVLETQEALDISTIRHLEQQGIGERRAEGYGRIVFNYDLDIQLDAHFGELFSQREETKALSPTAQTLAQRMAKQLLEQQVEQGITLFVRDEVIQRAGVIDNMPKNSQLGRLRVPVRRALITNDLAVVRVELDQFESTARRQFENARIQNVSLWDWLNDLLMEPDMVWNKIALSDDQLPAIAGHKAEKDDALASNTVLRLIEAVLTAPARERTKE